MGTGDRARRKDDRHEDGDIGDEPANAVEQPAELARLSGHARELSI